MPVRRKLIVCCDGTWQSSTSGERNIPSNVTRLTRHLARSEVKKEKDETVMWNQMTFYDPGIGTGDLTAADTKVQGGTGAGLAQNVIEAYNWLVLNYQPGDKIFCFGFSRGAYTARSLSGFISELGICDPLDMMWFPEIYKLYESYNLPVEDGEDPKITANRKIYQQKKAAWLSGGTVEFRLGDKPGTPELRTPPRKPIAEESKQIEVVGVWDTVGALGVPRIGGFKLPSFGNLDRPGREFHDVEISNNVRHAFHALAIDERRQPFLPTLWYVKKGVTRPQPPESSFAQVWFPGVHINCGGGSDDMLVKRQADFEQIAHTTFAWMVEQVRPYLAFDEESIKKSMDDQQDLLQQLNKNFGVKTAKSGWSVGAILDSFSHSSWSMQLGGMQWRSPGDTVVPVGIANPKPTRTLDLGYTNEEIHPSVYYRMQQLKQAPHALKKFKRQPAANKKNGWEWVKTREDAKGTIVLPEYQIKPHPTDQSQPKNFERLVAERNGAGNYLADLDEMYKSGVDKTKPWDRSMENYSSWSRTD